jgi:hypothetical protein
MVSNLKERGQNEAADTLIAWLRVIVATEVLQRGSARGWANW